MSGVIATKVGMSRIFLEDGEAVPVTYLKVEPNMVVRLKTKAKDGYDAAVLAVGAKKWKSRKGKENTRFKTMKEWKLADDAELKAGSELTYESIPMNAVVSISGVSKGKGFQGVIKRHGFSRGPETHGSHLHRKGGSIGMAEFPGRVMKGKKMAGRTGSDKITLKNREVVYVDSTNQLIAVKGPVPGSNGTTIFVTIESLPAAE